MGRLHLSETRRRIGPPPPPPPLTPIQLPPLEGVDVDIGGTTEMGEVMEMVQGVGGVGGVDVGMKFIGVVVMMGNIGGFDITG